ncbi:type II secretion system F family protein [Candidatus Wolfebacteria bacterium]|nr:type II secretion system F family protein [Candidatus Wolfebacteria bacterium]
MKFRYNARTQQGELQTGFVEATNREAAAGILTGHNLFVLSLESSEKRHRYDFITGIFNRVKISDLMIFTRQFATLMESKVPLNTVLKTLYKQTNNQILKEAVFQISSDIGAGLSLSQAMERQKGIFSEFYLNMIRSAEITGRLEEAAQFLADYLEKESIWKSKIRSAMIYPVIVIIMFIAVAGIMVVVVFPQIAPVFEETGMDLPVLTKIFLGAGSFIIQWWWAVLLILAIFIFVIADYFHTPEGEAVLDEISVKVPIIGNLFKKLYISRFAESTNILIKGGIPITQAIGISANAIGNVVYRDILLEMAEGVRGGELLSDLLAKNEYYFPILVSQMVAIGEGTGRLDYILSKVSDFYTREVNDALNNLVELIQPILIAGIGVLIGLLFASILIPIYNLAQAF